MRAITPSSTHIDLHGGKLRLDPLSGDLPEGHVNATLNADATQTPPAVALRLQVPALALQPLLAAMKVPGVITGTMQVQADLRGSGATPHAIAAGLDGSLSVAMANGAVDNRLLGGTLGSILRQADLLDLVGRGGTSQVQCFAAHLDAAHGIATVRSLVLASSLLSMDGSGSLNLGAETLDLRIRPQAKVAGTGVVVPLRISGPFRPPAAAPDAAAADYRECRNRGRCRAGQHVTSGAGGRRARGEATVRRRGDRLWRGPRGCARHVGRRSARRPDSAARPATAAKASERRRPTEAVVALRGRL